MIVVPDSSWSQFVAPPLGELSSWHMRVESWQADAVYSQLRSNGKPQDGKSDQANATIAGESKM